MTAFELATEMGLTIQQFEDYTNDCDDIVEAEQFVAILRDDEVHLAVKLTGLGGRKLLRDCKSILARWFEDNPVLLAPVKHANVKAIRLAEALGFRVYGETETHVWLVQHKEQFHAKPH